MNYRALVDFLNNRIDEVLVRERFNKQAIYLYRCGENWLALEHSVSFLKEFKFFECEPMVFEKRNGIRFVMVEVSDFVVRRLRARFAARRVEADCLMLYRAVG